MQDRPGHNFHSKFSTKNDKEKPGNITSWFNYIRPNSKCLISSKKSPTTPMGFGI